MRFCFIGLSLIIPYVSNAACEAERARWEHHVAACERASGAAGVVGIACGIAIPIVGGLFATPLAIEAASQDHHASIAKSNYDNCMRRHEEAIRQAAAAARSEEEKYQAALKYELHDLEVYRDKAMKGVRYSAKKALDQFIKVLSDEGADLDNPDTRAYILDETKSIQEKLDESIKSNEEIYKANVALLTSAPRIFERTICDRFPNCTCGSPEWLLKYKSISFKYELEIKTSR